MGNLALMRARRGIRPLEGVPDSAIARELLRNFPKGGKRRKRNKKRPPKRTSKPKADLAGTEADAVPAGGGDDEVSAVVDPVGDA